MRATKKEDALDRHERDNRVDSAAESRKIAAIATDLLEVRHSLAALPNGLFSWTTRQLSHPANVTQAR